VVAAVAAYVLVAAELFMGMVALELHLFATNRLKFLLVGAFQPPVVVLFINLLERHLLPQFFLLQLTFL
jgi:hypothetical protein